MEPLNPKELLVKMKEFDFVYDTKLGKAVNKNAEVDKEYIFKILDLLYDNYERVKFVDDMSSSTVGKTSWGLLLSQKFAMLDKRLPIPQIPFHMRYDGVIFDMSMKAKHAYLMLIGFFQELDEDIYVALNFKDEKYRKYYKAILKNSPVVN